MTEIADCDVSSIVVSPGDEITVTAAVNRELGSESDELNGDLHATFGLVEIDTQGYYGGEIIAVYPVNLGSQNAGTPTQRMRIPDDVDTSGEKEYAIAVQASINDSFGFNDAVCAVLDVRDRPGVDLTKHPITVSVVTAGALELARRFIR